MNNNSNNCGDCGTTCSECGRPWAICKQDGGCGCNKCKDIKFCEYGRMANGCIREKQPGCPMQAVIPSVTVESIEGIKNLADCLVHVSDINTTFYIDDKHRPIITWAGPIDIPGYDMEGNPNNYRDQIVTDVANQMAVIYDKSGKGYQFGLAENLDVQEEINNKLDEMAKDGTLQDIVDSYLDSLTGRVQYIFPKNWDGLSGDAGLIKAYGKTILIDTYRATNKTDLYQMLSDFNVVHIDYLILTHYHDDHIGNVVNLINDGIVDTESYIYLPPDCVQIAQDPTILAYKNEILASIASHNIPSGIPAEWSKLDIDNNFSIEFYNTDYTALSAMTNYNNCSTLCMIRHGATTSYWTGDALGSAQNRALANNFIKGHIDLYKVEHHGIQGDNTTINVQRKILPTYAVQTAFIRGLEQGIYDKSTVLAYLGQKGTRIYSCYLNKDYIVFGSTTDNMWIESGQENENVSNNNALGSAVYTMYVDANIASTYQDGRSWDTAFNDIGRAIAHAGKMGIGEVAIALKAGEYGLSPVTNSGEILPIQANGLDITIVKSGSVSVSDVVIKGTFNFRNCKVEIRNVTFKNDASLATNISATNCDLYIHDCVMDGSGATTPTFIWCQESGVRLNGNTISDYNLIVSGHVLDNISIYNNIITDVGTLAYCRGGEARAFGNTLTNVTNRINMSDGGYDIDRGAKVIYSGSIGTGDITLDESIATYNKLVVISGTVSGGTLYTDTIYSYYPANNFPVSATLHARSIDGMFGLAISDDGKTITVSRDGTNLNIRTLLAFKEPRY